MKTQNFTFPYHREVSYMFEDDDSAAIDNLLGNCVCPPAPKPHTVQAEDWLMLFFSVEWIVRVCCFEPPAADRAESFVRFLRQWLAFILEATTVLDFFAIFPYFMERFGSNFKGLVSLRLLRLFRVFQLVRLGQFNSSFMSLVNVLSKSLPYLRLLLVVLVFGATFFGSMVYWLEKGEWKFWEETGDFQFIRIAADGVTEEISPFTNVPQSFWWFMVTATTVGYGDLYPTSGGGKAVAVMAMLTGVLVIAFPVSVFSDLWQKEHQSLEQEYAASEDDDDELDEALEISSKDLKKLREHMKAVERHQGKIRDLQAKYSVET